MPNEYVELEAELEDEESELPFGFVIWGMAIHTVLSSVYFVLIACLAIAIDLGLHWFEELHWVQQYQLSPIIKWEVELMAYTLATVDTLLFLRALIQPGIQYIWRQVRPK